MIKLVKVLKEDENILHNLMHFYIYEFGQFIPTITLENNGAYKPINLSPFWDSPGVLEKYDFKIYRR